MKNKVVKFLVIANLIVLSAYVMTHVLTSKGRNTRNVALENEVAINLQNVGQMSKQDFKRFMDIEQAAFAGTRVNDDDLDFVLDHAKDASRGILSGTRDIYVIAVLSSMRNVTPAQRSKVFDKFMPVLLAPSGPDKEGRKADVGRVMASIGEKKAAPYLLPLLNSPDPTIRKSVTNSLNALGYQVPEVQRRNTRGNLNERP